MDRRLPRRRLPLPLHPQRPAGERVYVVINATPVPREGYRIGVPTEGYYREILNTDSELYGGSGVGNQGGVQSDPQPWHGEPSSIVITIPPLAAVAFEL